MIPAGLIPHFVVSNAAQAIEFYRAAFGAEEVSRMPAPDGRLMHAALKIGDHTFFLNDDFPEHCGGVSRLPVVGSPLPITFHHYVPDTDAAIARAAAAGATITMPAADMFWGDRYGRVMDPYGYEWSFGTPLAK